MDKHVNEGGDATATSTSHYKTMALQSQDMALRAFCDVPAEFQVAPVNGVTKTD